ncbi:FCS-Like Zinc finger 8-like [Vicia villosa]|uniref:FCS-Like Zinc finger 8-like n=1 Tax=Vicia villosa TaxID=3911 RepID=UPI00273B3386|nr:FCS-Like Zinc finger 8-like [Vicia villosa]
MLLRNRSRAVTKPNIMADHTSQQSSNNQNCAKKSIPSLFNSPKLFRDFTTNNNNTTLSEALKSPTSILDTRILLLSTYGFGKSFFHEKKIQTASNKTFSSRSIGLALIGNDDSVDDNDSVEPNKGSVLFGTQLRVKIPSLPSPIFSSIESQSQTKTKESPSSMSLSEMELSEEYTCVKSHGPNPRTTHIFNNYVVEESYCCLPQKSDSSYGNFLGVCYTCKKHLEHTKDIFIYRGEKAFCSKECRHREMVIDGVESSEEYESTN